MTKSTQSTSLPVNSTFPSEPTLKPIILQPIFNHLEQQVAALQKQFDALYQQGQETQQIVAEHFKRFAQDVGTYQGELNQLNRACDASDEGVQLNRPPSDPIANPETKNSEAKEASILQTLTELQGDLYHVQDNLSRHEREDAKRNKQWHTKLHAVETQIQPKLSALEKLLQDMQTRLNDQGLLEKLERLGENTTQGMVELKKQGEAIKIQNEEIKEKFQTDETLLANFAKISFNFLRGIHPDKLTAAMIKQLFLTEQKHWETLTDSSSPDTPEKIEVYIDSLLKWCGLVILKYHFKNDLNSYHINRVSLFLQKLDHLFAPAFILEIKQALITLAKLKQHAQHPLASQEQNELKIIHQLLQTLYAIDHLPEQKAGLATIEHKLFDPALEKVQTIVTAYYERYPRRLENKQDAPEVDEKALKARQENWQNKRHEELCYPDIPQANSIDFKVRYKKECAAIENLVYALCSRTNEASHYGDEYTKLPIPFKKIFWRSLKKTLPMYVASQRMTSQEAQQIKRYIAEYPDDSGFRINYHIARKKWDKTLNACVDELLPPAMSAEELNTLKTSNPHRILMSWIDHQGHRKQGLIKKIYQDNWVQKGFLTRDGQFKKALDPKERKKIREALESKGEKIPDGRSVTMKLYAIDHGKLIKTRPPLAFIKVKPELAGRQNLAEDMMWRICGYGAIGTLCRFDILNTTLTYPVYFSEVRNSDYLEHSDQGITLQDKLRRSQYRADTLMSIEKALWQDAGFSFTLNLLKILILCVGDEKFDNLAIEFYIMPNGQRAARLISFDSERIFVEPLEFLGKATKIGIKSVLLCMELINQPLNVQALHQFCELDAATLLSDWLITQEVLDSKHIGRRYQHPPFTPLFSYAEMQNFSNKDEKKNEPASHLPAILDPGIARELYQKIFKLQTILKCSLHGEETIPTGLELINQWYPRWASFYEDALQRFSSTQKRFDSLPSDYIFDEEPLLEKASDEVATNTVPSTATPTNSDLKIEEKKSSESTQAAKLITQPSLTPTPQARTARSMSVQTTSTHPATSQTPTVGTGRYSASVSQTRQILDIQQAILNHKIHYPQNELAVLKLLTPIYQQTERVRQAFIQGKIQPFLELGPRAEVNYIKERVLNSIYSDLAACRKINPKLTDAKLSRLLMAALNQGEYQEMRFRDCAFLSDKHLETLFKKSKQVYLLEITQCSQVTESLIQNLPKYAPYLHRLKLIDLPQLKYFYWSLGRYNWGALKFAYLKELNLQDCKALQSIHLETTEPVNLVLTGCTALQHLSFKPVIISDAKSGAISRYPDYVATTLKDDHDEEHPHKFTSRLAHLFDRGILVKRDMAQAEAFYKMIPKGECVESLQGHKDFLYGCWVYCLAELTSGLIASGSDDHTIKLWENRNGSYACVATLREHTDSVSCIIELVSGLIASGSHDQTIKLWKNQGGSYACVTTLSEHTDSVSCIIELASGLIASGSHDQTIRLWENRGGSYVYVGGHKQMNRVNCLIELSNGLIASGSANQMIRLWENRGGIYVNVKILSGHTKGVLCLTELSSGLIASGSADHTIKLWESRRGKYVCVETLRSTGSVTCIIELASGLIASGSRDDDRTIRLWENQAGSYVCVKTLRGTYSSYSYRVRCLTELSNGLIASGGGCDQDYTIKLWEVGGRALEHTAQEHETSELKDNLESQSEQKDTKDQKDEKSDAKSEHDEEKEQKNSILEFPENSANNSAVQTQQENHRAQTPELKSSQTPSTILPYPISASQPTLFGANTHDHKEKQERRLSHSEINPMPFDTNTTNNNTTASLSTTLNISLNSG